MVTGGGSRSGRGEENRYSRRILSRVKVLFGTEAPQYLGYALNLSANGLYLSSTRVYQPRTELRLRLEPIGESAIDLRGRVRWGQRIPPSLASVVKPGMGIQIETAPREYLDFFSRLVKRNPQRTHPRLEARLEVRFYRRESFLKEYTENISRGGLFVATAEAVEPGTEVRVDLVIPDLATVWQITGRVAYRLDDEAARRLECRPGIGIEITAMDPQVAEAFRSYVQRIMRLYE